MAGKSVGQVADYFCDLIGKLDQKPAIVGHSFGGLLAQMSAGRGLSAATVAVDTENPERGPLLVISGEKDHTVPHAIAHASYERQARNKSALTEFVEIKGRGHALTIDSGWREVADTALAFVQRF
jgi:pimeloyl-ACP methyl ester carboxylesterase